MTAPTRDHLLRTFAAVRPGTRVLDLGCGPDPCCAPLARLGLAVYACDTAAEAVASARRELAPYARPGDQRTARVDRLEALGYPDGYFGWLVAFDLLHRTADRTVLLDVLAEARRVLTPGGWLYVTAPALPETVDLASNAASFAGDSAPEPVFTAETLTELFATAGFAVAEAPTPFPDAEPPALHAIYRRVAPDTVG